MVLKTFKRYELKYMLNREEFEIVVHALKKKMDYDPYCVDGNRYNIYNVYFDTDDDAVIRHSISSPYYKEKLRLRSYKIPGKKDKVFLELKKKIGGVVNKRRALMNYEEAIDFVNNPTINLENSLDKQVLEEIKYYLSNNSVKPKVFIRYERLAFFDKENDSFRVSFDSNIMTRRKDVNLHMGDFGEDLVDDGLYLMEVKCGGGMPLWFCKIISEMKLRKASFSKYGNEYKKYREDKEISIFSNRFIENKELENNKINTALNYAV